MAQAGNGQDEVEPRLMDGDGFFDGIVIAFMLCALSGAIMGGLIVGLVWWLS